MAELGIDISHHRSKHVDAFSGQTFDLVITVCDKARDTCPIFPGGMRRLHHALEDPAAVDGEETVRLAAFRRVRDQLRAYLVEVADAAPATS